MKMGYGVHMADRGLQELAMGFAMMIGMKPWSVDHDRFDVHGISDLEVKALTMKRKARAMRAMLN